jgi:hypothetical protein
MSFLTHTPHWVFVLLFALLAFGIQQTFPRRLSLRRSMVLPLVLVLVLLSLIGVVSAFGEQPLALTAWAAGLASAVLALWGRVDTSSVQYAPRSQTFQMPGSRWPLALMMGLFAVKYTVGATLSLHPEMRQAAPLMVAASGAYGLFSGVFLGRAMALWAPARSASATAPELAH